MFQQGNSHSFIPSIRLTAQISSAITETALNAQMKALTTLFTCNCSRLW